MAERERAGVFIDADLERSADCSTANFEIHVSSKPRPGRDTPNEDAAGVFDLGRGGVVVAVADGLGGLPRGQAAAACAVETLWGHVTVGELEPEHLRSAILDAFEEANRDIIASGNGGTTLVVAEIQGDRLRTYHVGDSAAMLVGQRGARKWETISHSPVGYGVAAGLIDEAKALEHEDRHYLSNHLGTPEMHIEVGSPVKFADKDTLLVASDGVLDNIAPEMLGDIIRKGPLDRAAERVIEEVEARTVPEDATGKPDDATFILVRRRPRSKPRAGTGATR